MVQRPGRLQANRSRGVRHPRAISLRGGSRHRGYRHGYSRGCYTQGTHFLYVYRSPREITLPLTLTRVSPCHAFVTILFMVPTFERWLTLFFGGLLTDHDWLPRCNEIITAEIVWVFPRLILDGRVGREDVDADFLVTIHPRWKLNTKMKY